MTPARHQIKLFLKRSHSAVALLATLKGIVRAVPFLLLSLLSLGSLDQYIGFSSWGRQLFWIVVICGGILLFVSGYWPFKIFSLKFRSQTLAKRLRSALARQEWRVDELLLAQDFLQEVETKVGVSTDLKEQYLDHLAAQLKNISAFSCFPPTPWRNRFLSAILVSLTCGSLWAFFPGQFPLSPRFLFPFGSGDLTRMVGILPGDAYVDWGGTLDVRVSLLSKSLEKPSLFVKVGDDWRPVPATKEFELVQTFSFERVVEPLYYRVFYKNEWSRKFTITPRRPIEIKSFAITIRPPTYVGEAVTKQTEPEIKALAGSDIEIHVQLSEPVDQAKIVFSGGAEKEMTMDQGTGLTVHFSMDQEGTYGLSAGAEGHAVGSRYPLHLAVDQSPTITLLSPDQDLIVGDKEKLPLTFEAGDDFGVSRIKLIWEGRGQTARDISLPLASSHEKNVFSTFEWNLALENFQPGEILRYRLEVWDGNTVTGPGRDVTPWHTLEIASFDKAHDSLEKALEAWREKAVQTLAQVNTLEAKIKKETGSLEPHQAQQNQAEQSAKDLEELLKKIVDRMENDPLSDYGVWLEHKAMADNLSALNQGEMKEAKEAIQSNNKQKAAEKLEQVSAELERMSALSEDLSRTQKAKDMVEAGNDLEKLGEDLVNQLQSGDPKAMAQVKALMDQAAKLLQEVAKTLQSMPQDLPEDFVNQPALKKLELGKSMDLLSQIQKAIQEGNMGEAMRLAQSFLQAAKNMKSQLSKAQEGFEQSNSAEELEKAVSEEQKKLDAIVTDQLKILADTQKLEGKRLKAVMAAQEKLLEELSKRQQAVIQAAEALARDEKTFDPIRVSVRSQMAAMVNVGLELTKKAVDKSPSWLGDILLNFKGLEKDLVKTASPIGKESFSLIINEEEDILKKLKEGVPPPDSFDGEDKKSFSELEKKQQSLAAGTQELKKKIQTLSRKTASLGVKLSQSLQKASDEMSSASQALKGQSSQAAFTAEENALRHLMEGQDQMEGASGGMSGMGQGHGKGSGSGGGRSLRVIQRGGGQSGTQSGPVRLPSADEYKAPKEFREELLKSLKEKYPKVYEDVIQKYYKRLSE